jgi:hypothetical protein
MQHPSACFSEKHPRNGVRSFWNMRMHRSPLLRCAAVLLLAAAASAKIVTGQVKLTSEVCESFLSKFSFSPNTPGA